ncbi:MAG: hypothetical protein UW24_C0001G0003 [Parcubacteria group bacterium GW2011_GWA2_44_12]|nr:MAG: hypothetical protein UW24_C0001G0003 [Parcubacteria group bacterium GW2011_GWA2_44_12]
MHFKKILTKIALAVSIILMGMYAFLVFEIYSYPRISKLQNVDAILVLGAAQWNSKPSPVFALRLTRAFELLTQAIFIDEKSIATLQGMREVASLAQLHNIHSVLLVSSDFHLFRTAKMARDLGMQAFLSPVVTHKGAQKLKYVLRESAGYVLYLFFKI